MTTAMHRTWAATAELGRSVGEPAIARAVPVYAGVAVVGAVLFGPTGMRAADLVDAMQGSAPVGLVLWSAWLIALAPAARTLYRGEAGFYLRALPVPLALHLAVPALVGLALHALWIGVMIAGADVATGAAAGFAAASASALIALCPRHAGEALIRAGLFAGLGVALWFDVPAPALGAASLALYLPLTAMAWSRAPERARRRDLLRVAGPAAVALGVSALASIWRGGRSALGRALLFTAGGGAAIGLVAGSNHIDGAGFGALLVGVGGLALAAALGAIAAALVEHERAAAWLLDATGASGALRVAAASLPCALLGVGCGLALGALAAWLVGASGVDLGRALGFGAVAGGGWALIALATARWCQRAGGVDGTLVMIVLLLAALALAVAAALLGELALALVVALAVGTSLVHSDRLERPA